MLSLRFISRLRPAARCAVSLTTSVLLSAQLSAQIADGAPMPSLSGASAWLNSAPLTAKALRGKVVLIDFWTYSCVNCLRALPYVKAWDAKYRAQGLVVIGVHSPEFDFEHDPNNVKKSLAKLGVTYPVALDNDMKVWNAFENHYWPAEYVIDATGHIRHHHFGEGAYDETERVIQQLLAESSNHTARGTSATSRDTALMVTGNGVTAAADSKNVRSPETYLGYGRGERFASVERAAHDAVRTYSAPSTLALNQWAFTGAWLVGGQMSTTSAPNASIVYRFHARDVHLVLGTTKAGTRVPFHVTIDGHAPGGDAGADVDANGNGVVSEHRLYQLIRQRGAIRDRTITITFDGPGVEAYSFTFG